ncbi:uncharacterized protein [Oryza sativa Japonica Group]|uniref:uncharacterized protein isoform X2 n=1 Tax=Oryza sativa subsp. japonica TaxID=39947 RepID=UPI0007755C59|nr:uncharacterized protein LOC107281389 isoform X3 [Oryza sativa Japonica Group]
MAPVISSVVAATPVSAGGDAAAASAPPAVEPPAAPACQLKLTPVLVEHPGLSIELTIRAVVRPISPNCESKPPPVTKTSIGPMHSLQDPVGPLEPESDPHDTFQDPKNDPRGEASWNHNNIKKASAEASFHMQHKQWREAFISGNNHH